MEQIFIKPKDTVPILNMSLGNVLQLCRTDKTFPCMKHGSHYRINKTRLQEWADLKCGIAFEGDVRNIRK